MPRNSKTTPSLDIYSTSQTSQGEQQQTYQRCANAAPYFYTMIGTKTAKVIQGCCNDWNCPRCGLIRAKEEYWRCVNGWKELSDKGRRTWMLTITCKGKEESVKSAQAFYLERTNRFLTSMRTKAKRAGMDWEYVQVTEYQQRGAPHSHLIITFMCDDLKVEKRYRYVTDNRGKKKREYYDALRSDWIEKALKSSGLGDQYDIQEVRSLPAVSRYITKYMFKSLQQTTFPKHWKRIRYSQTFPKQEKGDSEFTVLLSGEDWRNLAKRATIIVSSDKNTREEAKRMISLYGDVLVTSS